MSANKYAILSGGTDLVPTRLIDGTLSRVVSLTIVTTNPEPVRWHAVPTAKPLKSKTAQWKRELKGRRP